MGKVLLSIDGGGVLGIGPATYMRYLEREFLLPRPDILAGASVGSILAAACAAGMSWTEARRRFMEQVPTIFRKPGWAWRLDPRKPRYDGTGLVEVLYGMFGAQRMNQLSIPLFVVAMDYRRGCPKVFGPEDGTPVWEAVAASCSAPTYFPPRDGLVDGGLVANSPAMVGIAGAVSKLGVPLEQLWGLSLGTNGDYWQDPKVCENTGALDWARLLLGAPTRGNEELSEFQARTVLRGRYLRVEPVLLRDWQLDGVKDMAAYSAIWEGLARHRGQHAAEFVRVARESTP